MIFLVKITPLAMDTVFNLWHRDLQYSRLAIASTFAPILLASGEHSQGLSVGRRHTQSIWRIYIVFLLEPQRLNYGKKRAINNEKSRLYGEIRCLSKLRVQS